MLLRDIQTWVSLSKPVQHSVIGEGWADEHDVIESTTEWAVEMFHKKLHLARVGWPNDERIEGDFAWIHFSTAQILTVSSVC